MVIAHVGDRHKYLLRSTKLFWCFVSKLQTYQVRLSGRDLVIRTTASCSERNGPESFRGIYC